MPKLPVLVDFDETQFPGLQDIFRELDSAIAAIVASDPAFRARRTIRRRDRTSRTGAAIAARPRPDKQVAA
ncbi:MAG TPA: hypothetical protein VGB81_03690 [Devosia sp.]|jgi:hypothetical protein